MKQNIRLITLLTANKTGIFQNIFLLLLLCSQVCKGINDDTKDEIKNNDDDNEEEQHVVNDSGSIKWLVNRRSSKNVSDSTTIPKTLVEGRNKAYE